MVIVNDVGRWTLPAGWRSSSSPERDGVLKNIETTATDEARREHTLPVTVREVSILGSPLVYSDLTHGISTVYAPTRDAFDGTAKAILAELDGTIVSAPGAIERMNAPLTASPSRVEFTWHAPSSGNCSGRYFGENDLPVIPPAKRVE